MEQQAGRKNWLVPLVVIGLVAGGLTLFSDQLPLQALSSNAGQAAAITGLLGKATHAQQKLQTRIDGLKGYDPVDSVTASELDQGLASIDKDMKLAWNLMNANGASQQNVGVYYARMKIQEQLREQVTVLKGE